MPIGVRRPWRSKGHRSDPALRVFSHHPYGGGLIPPPRGVGRSPSPLSPLRRHVTCHRTTRHTPHASHTARSPLLGASARHATPHHSKQSKRTGNYTLYYYTVPCGKKTAVAKAAWAYYDLWPIGGAPRGLRLRAQGVRRGQGSSQEPSKKAAKKAAKKARGVLQRRGGSRRGRSRRGGSRQFVTNPGSSGENMGHAAVRSQPTEPVGSAGWRADHRRPLFWPCSRCCAISSLFLLCKTPVCLILGNISALLQ
jgi:hypothetical protein